MTADIASLIAGLVLLVVAGDLLVRGAVNLSLRLGIPPLIVGLTVVAFGTSAPELLVSVGAVLDHAPGIALGNVVGSNIANVLLVLGIPAVILPIAAGPDGARRSYLTMLAATALFIGLCFTGPFGPLQGLVLLAGLCLAQWDNYRTARQGDASEAMVEGQDPRMPRWKMGLFLALGLAGLPLGAELLVQGAANIARAAGISETVIGLTLVAFGTSLPELAAGISAALRRQSGMAIGNVVGSNVFNLLGIIGIAAFFGRIPVPADMLRLDLWVMLAAALVVAPVILLGRSITRAWGAGLILAYLGYIVVLAI